MYACVYMKNRVPPSKTKPEQPNICRDGYLSPFFILFKKLMCDLLFTFFSSRCSTLQQKTKLINSR